MNESEKKPISSKLVMPEGVAPTGAVMDAADACMRAIIALPEILAAILAELQGINDGISVISLYAEKKGLAESLFGPDDLKAGEDDGKEPE
jgi:hypothetical protein